MDRFIGFAMSLLLPSKNVFLKSNMDRFIDAKKHYLKNTGISILKIQYG